MKKWKKILMAMMMVMSVTMLCACGERTDNAADESPIEDDADMDDADEADDGADGDEIGIVPDDNDTVPDNSGNAGNSNAGNSNAGNNNAGDNNNANNTNTTDTQPDTDNDGTVSGELGDSVKDLGDGVGNAVDDIGNAVGNAVEGR